jgi:hypothetical protein
MYPISVSTSDASGGTVTSSIVAMDTFMSQFQATIACVVTGTATYTVQYTLDKIQADGYSAASGNWFSLTDLASKSATLSASMAFPVTGIRLSQSAGNGSVVMTVLQTGAGN